MQDLDIKLTKVLDLLSDTKNKSSKHELDISQLRKSLDTMDKYVRQIIESRIRTEELEMKVSSLAQQTEL